MHDFYELLVIACARCCVGGLGRGGHSEDGEGKGTFLRGFLKLENGLPSRDTFSRLFRDLDAGQFRVWFQQFMAQFPGTARAW